jgi:hypothetical protein
MAVLFLFFQVVVPCSKKYHLSSYRSNDLGTVVIPCACCTKAETLISSLAVKAIILNKKPF